MASFIGRVLKSERQKRKMKQRTLAELSGIDQGNISKIETSEIITPTDETLRKLARGLQIEDEDYLVHLKYSLPKSAQRPVPTNRETLDVGFAFCIWAAPLIAMEGDIPPGVRLVGCESVSHEGAARRWLQGRDSNQWWRPASPVSPNSASNRWGGERFYSAAELIPMLLDGDLDCVAIAGESYLPDDTALVRCCEMLHSVGGPDLLLVVARDENTEGLDAKAAWQYFIDKKDAPLFFGSGTNAESVATTLKRDLYLRNNASEKWMVSERFRDVRLAEFGDFFDEVLEGLIEAGKSFAFVGWQPHISWLSEQTRAKGNHRVITIKSDLLPSILAPQLEALPYQTQYISFDLLVSRKRLKQWLTDEKLETLIDAIDRYAKALSNINGAPTSIIRKVANYLQISQTECEMELKGLQFSVSYDPLWVKNLMHLVREQP